MTEETGPTVATATAHLMRRRPEGIPEVEWESLLRALGRAYLREASHQLYVADADDKIGGQAAHYLGEGIGYAAKRIDPDNDEEHKPTDGRLDYCTCGESWTEDHERIMNDA